MTNDYSCDIMNERAVLERDFLHEIARQLSRNSLPSLLRFRAVSEVCEVIGNRAIANSLNKTVDASVVYSNQNPIILKPKEMKSDDCAELHEDVRRLLSLLEKIGESHGDSSLNLVNFQSSSLHWLRGSIKKIRRCPAVLQKRIKKLYHTYYKGSINLTYDDYLLRPSRFLSIVSKQSSHIAILNLGDIKNTAKLAMHENLFPHLPNLEVFVWTRAESKFIQVLPSPHKLTHASITFRRGHLLVEHIGPVLNCQGLAHLFLGFRAPKFATRFDMEVLLNSYQLFWNRRNYTPRNMYTVAGFIPVKASESSMDGRDYCYRAFPKMKRIGFWNSPSSLFQVMCEKEYSFHTLQWGELNQGLNRLCSIDSVLESLFTYEAVQSYDYHFADHAKLYLHSMPVVSLEYYIPQLMALLGKIMSDVKTLEIFIKSSTDSAMPSGWLLSEKRPRKCSSIFTKMTHFSFHVDNMCLLTNLDILLPPTLTSLTLSFVVSLNAKKEFLDSLLNFIDKLDDPNRFPDLEEFHVQVYGIKSFEVVLEHIIEVIPDLKKLSILCLPISDENDVVIEVLKRTIKTCKNLKSLALCPILINRLTGLSQSLPEDYFRWRNKLHSFFSNHDLIFESGTVSIGTLPICNGFDKYVVPPFCYEGDSSDLECAYDKFDRVKDKTQNSLNQEQEEQESLNDDDDYDDSFVSDDLGVEAEEDELDILEKKLEPENKRLFRRENRKRKISVSEEESTDDEDVIVFKRKNRKICDDKDGDAQSESEGYTDCDSETDNEHRTKKCSFLDDEAEENNDEESESDTEEEPFLEEIESETEDCVRHSVEIKNAQIRSQIIRKKKIIDSDSD
ncbi:unnamed protein product [Auanema sp. JU1783]|nr:unnamed protein product [Auanema sp. JU1783]